MSELIESIFDSQNAYNHPWASVRLVDKMRGSVVAESSGKPSELFSRTEEKREVHVLLPTRGGDKPEDQYCESLCTISYHRGVLPCRGVAIWGSASTRKTSKNR
jgi:hypothetical protein